MSLRTCSIHDGLEADAPRGDSGGDPKGEQGDCSGSAWAGSAVGCDAATSSLVVCTMGVALCLGGDTSSRDSNDVT